jgi:hypothetical protein
MRKMSSCINTPTFCRVVVPRFTDRVTRQPLGKCLATAKCCLLGLALWGSGHALCADPVLPPVNAGDLMRNLGNLEQVRRANAPGAQKDIYPPEWAIGANDTTDVALTTVQIRGNHQIPNAVLMADVEPLLANITALSQVKTLTDTIAKRYSDAQIPARVYVPVQKFQRQSLIIQIIEYKAPVTGNP